MGSDHGWGKVGGGMVFRGRNRELGELRLDER